MTLLVFYLPVKEINNTLCIRKQSTRRAEGVTNRCLPPHTRLCHWQSWFPHPPLSLGGLFNQSKKCEAHWNGSQHIPRFWLHLKMCTEKTMRFLNSDSQSTAIRLPYLAPSSMGPFKKSLVEERPTWEKGRGTDRTRMQKSFLLTWLLPPWLCNQPRKCGIRWSHFQNAPHFPPFQKPISKCLKSKITISSTWQEIQCVVGVIPGCSMFPVWYKSPCGGRAR